MNPWQILKTISVIFRAKKIWFTKNPINNRVGDGILSGSAYSGTIRTPNWPDIVGYCVVGLPLVTRCSTHVRTESG